MSGFVALTLAASATVAATGLGAIHVWVLGVERSSRVSAGLTGLAAGAMVVASVVGLLAPGLREGGAGAVAAGALAGVGFMLGLRRYFGDRPDRHWLAVAGGLFVHSLPEGLAVGTAFASHTRGLGLFVVLAIALQNVPEGTATAIPMQRAGFSGRAQVGAALVTSIPQLPGAILAYLAVEAVTPLLPVSFGFAAGAMLALVARDMAPEALAGAHRAQGLGGLAIGGAVMVALTRVAAF